MNILDLSGSTGAAIAAAVALVPALVAYLRGRQLARFADDPALPERLFSGRHVTASWLIVTITALIFLTGWAAIWAIPLAVIAYVAAGLPLRRMLYNETWSLAFYLSFVIRFFFAGWSFWLLVCALPIFTLWAGDQGWMAALAMAGGLTLFAGRQTELIRWLVGAKPIADQPVRARFDRLVATAGLPSPHFEFIDLKGGSFANAFALASLGRGAVVFTSPLLERLDPDETDAICAHELAHLEYHNTRRLRRQRLICRSLVVAGAVVTPVVKVLAPAVLWLACTAWPLVVLVAIAVLVHDRQKHETASDLRASALTGNPEALVRALVKLHAMARVPRRWDADLERHMSHPSLKRRVQDIRAAAGTPPAALGDTAVFESADGTASVVFGDETLEWIEGASASYRVRYDRLSELRIAAAGTSHTTLLAADRAGHRWQMPVRVDDVPRIQAVLDIIDSRVDTGAAASSLQPVLIRAITFSVCIVSLNAGLLGVAMVVAMTLTRAEASLLGAAGLASMAGAVLTWRDPGTMYGYIPDGFETIFATVLLGGGALLVWLAYGRRRDQVSRRAWNLVGVIAAAAVASWVLSIVGGGFDAVGLHQAARGSSSTIVLPLALVGAMLCSTRRACRIAATVPLVASITAGGVASRPFLDRFGGDMFLLPTTDLKVRTLDRPVKEFTVPFGMGELHLSPDGESIAAVSRRPNGRSSVHIGRAGETLTSLEADGALFVDDERVLIWTVDGSRTDLREVLVAAPATTGWELRVTGLTTPTVSFDASTKRWRLASRAAVGAMEAREGVVGTGQIASYRWNVPEGRSPLFVPVAMTGDRVLALEPRPDLTSPVTNPLGAVVFVLASGARWRSTLWALGPEGPRNLGTSRLELECHPLPLAGRGACQIFDASRTRFFEMDAGTGAISPVASLPGRFFVGDEPDGSWLTGWYQSGLVAVRLAPPTAIRVAGPDGSRAHLLSASDHAMAAVWPQFGAAAGMVEPIYQGTSTSLVRIYSID